MKNRMFVTLVLFIAFALPAGAQQTHSTPSTQQGATGQTAATSQSTNGTSREPLRDTHGDFWDGDEPSAAALIFHPFASKAYVRRQTTPIRDRVNELEERTAANGGMAKDVDARAERGIQLASDKTKEAEQHAVDASSKSDSAQQTASAVNSRLPKAEAVVGGLDQYKVGTQTVIRFKTGQSVLSKEAKQALDEMASQLKDQHGYVVEMHGYSSGRGQAAVASSRKMADSVVRYLVLNREIPAYRMYVVGMGNATPVGQGAADKRGGSRVEISVLKNSLEQRASASSTGTTPAPQ